MSSLSTPATEPSLPSLTPLQRYNLERANQAINRLESGNPKKGEPGIPFTEVIDLLVKFHAQEPEVTPVAAI